MGKFPLISVGSRSVQSQFRVQIREQDSGTVVTLSGELDLAASPALEEALERVFASDAELVVIDLRELEFMDSTGLSILVRAHHEAEAGDWTLYLVKGSAQVQRLLSLTGVADRMSLIDAPEDVIGGA